MLVRQCIGYEFRVDATISRGHNEFPVQLGSNESGNDAAELRRVRDQMEAEAGKARSELPDWKARPWWRRLALTG